MLRKVIVGTRKSELALTQAEAVVAKLQNVCEREGLNFTFELKKIVTKGDKILDVTLSKVGGKGLFVKEIEQAMIDKEIDFAVHSMKDMPAELQEGLIAAAITEREDPRDCLVTRDHMKLSELPSGAKIGTSSLRRSCQLRAYRPDLEIGFVRGNIGTRISKIETEGFDGVILAAAGLKRVGWEDKISDYLPENISLPAVGQGALGIECREDDDELIDLLNHINDAKTSQTVTAERSFLARLNGGCQFPIAAYATLEGDQAGGQIVLTGLVGTPDGNTILKETMRGNEPAEVGIALAEKLLGQGADEILRQHGG